MVRLTSRRSGQDLRDHPAAPPIPSRAKPGGAGKAHGKAQPADREISIADAVSEVFSEFEELKDELTNWAEGMPDSMQGGDKHGEVEQAAEDIDLDEPDVPPVLQQIVIKFPPQRGRKPRSRADRRDAALYTLEAVLAVLDRALEGNMTISGVVIPVGDKEAVKQLQTDLEDVKEKAEAVDFPGR